MTTIRPYVVAIAASMPIMASIVAFWLMSGGDETCGPNGCNVGDMMSVSGLLHSYIVALPLFMVSVVRCS